MFHPFRLAALLGCLALTSLLCAALPAGVTLPLTVLDVNFNQDALGKTPHPRTKAEIEAAGVDGWQKLPIRTYSALDFTMRQRVATVEKAPNGFTDPALLFVVTEAGQPTWGPRMWFGMPRAVSDQGKRYRLTMDISMATLASMGGVLLWDVREIGFFVDGTIRVSNTEIGRYVPNVPVHIEALLDDAAKTVTFTVNNKTAQAITLPYAQQKASFNCFLLLGITPGGHCEVGRIAFDNIKLVMEEAR